MSLVTEGLGYFVNTNAPFRRFSLAFLFGGLFFFFAFDLFFFPLFHRRESLLFYGHTCCCFHKHTLLVSNQNHFFLICLFLFSGCFGPACDGAHFYFMFSLFCFPFFCLLSFTLCVCREVRFVVDIFTMLEYVFFFFFFSFLMRALARKRHIWTQCGGWERWKVLFFFFFPAASLLVLFEEKGNCFEWSMSFFFYFLPRPHRIQATRRRLPLVAFFFFRKEK